MSALSIDRYVMDLVSNANKGDRAKLDSHADTCVGGRNVTLLHEMGFHVNVSAYSPEYDALTNIPVATCAGAYDSKTDGITYLLIWNEMMFFGNIMPTSLINVNQICAYGHIVDDCPQQYNSNSSHSVRTQCGMEMPLKMRGVISYLPVRKPTNDEITNSPRLIMTSDMPWDPHSQDFANAEQLAARQACALGPQETIMPKPKASERSEPR
jgi:hypothetical protein